MSTHRRERITFKATKIVSKPVKVGFYTESGQKVEFKAHKNMPKSVKIDFLAKRPK